MLCSGKVAPSGKLTTTWVRSVGYVGTGVQPYWQLPQIDTTSWVDGPATPLFAFGTQLLA